MRVEDQMLAAIFRFAEMHEHMYPDLKLLHHIPNEGRRKPWVAKRSGIKSGVPDLCLPVSRHGYHGFYLEIKAPNKKPTDSQKKWLMDLELNGYFAGWSDDIDYVCKALLWYIK